MTAQVREITFDSRDEYRRKPVAEKVIHMLASGVKISPLVIDGGWGVGKTEFCHKLINLIEVGDTGHRAVYVDAFKADHADEPLMTLLAAVLKLLPEKERPSLIKKAIPVVRFGVKTTLKAGIGWLLRQDAVDLGEGLESELKTASDEAINQAIESLLADHVAAEESIQTLQVALGELAKANPIVVFVDELDRCRPDFAVAMLESIKHVFDIKGVQFVLVTNLSQLRASINHCYGSAIEAQRYLDKFIGFSFRLPATYKRDGHMEVFASIQHLHSCISSSVVLERSSILEVSAFLEGLVSCNRLSLREVETFVRYLEIYQALTGGTGFNDRLIFGYRLLRVLGVYLFCFKPECADVLSHGIVDVTAIASAMGKTKLLDLADGVHPDHADIVTAMVGSEASLYEKQFAPATEELKQQWEGMIRGCFSSGFAPAVGERTKIIAETIYTLRLGV